MVYFKLVGILSALKLEMLSCMTIVYTYLKVSFRVILIVLKDNFLKQYELFIMFIRAVMPCACRWLPAFWGSIPPTSSGWRSSHHMTLQPRKPGLTSLLPWETKVSNVNCVCWCVDFYYVAIKILARLLCLKKILSC